MKEFPPAVNFKAKRWGRGKAPPCNSRFPPFCVSSSISPPISWKETQTHSLIWPMTEEEFLKADLRKGLCVEHMKNISVNMRYLVKMVCQMFWSCHVFIRGTRRIRKSSDALKMLGLSWRLAKSVTDNWRRGAVMFYKGDSIGFQ